MTQNAFRPDSQQEPIQVLPDAAPRYVKGTLPDLSAATIGQFVKTAEITESSDVVLSVPAGPNRVRNLIPTLNVASSFQRTLPGVSVSIDLAIDFNEALREIVGGSAKEGMLAASEIRKYFPEITDCEIKLKPRLQPVSNSVVETISAMHEAAAQGATHLIAPRFGRALAGRVGRGLAHYSKQTGSSSLEVVSSPAHSLHADVAPGKSKRAALEIVSYLAGEMIYRLGGSSLYEQFTERKGVFERVAKKAQEIKLRNFERGDDAREISS